ncbi:MAG: 6,7-dimethyl-8-ribityllumazine synthase [Calditrichaeota bacterium]|nr:MAG: 6,7-dimethyl-8-ribityllumazine synthase [Calditrichota bacterium]MBL1206408.1 6,7-dimethyl-8-ribityllumazine synthase [Calditrichota bacterium]NOG46234.1 6,7-dimethyl-8-ribityllumazine synthase [Calditrichota bacterium]
MIKVDGGIVANIIEGKLSAKGKKFGIVVGRFNSLISSKLLEGAIDCIVRHEGDQKNISIAWCPGAFEISQVAKKMVSSGSYDAIICLGAVIRGATPHFDYVAGMVARGIGQLNLEYETPVSFGILTTETIEQALERAGTKSGNKGWDTALTAIEMADLLQKL